MASIAFATTASSPARQVCREHRPGTSNCSPFQTPQSQNADAAGSKEPQTPSQPCPCCGGRMIIIETFVRGCSPRTRPVMRDQGRHRHDDHRHIAISQCASVLPLLHRPRRRSLRSATRTSKEDAFADQRTVARPQRPAQPRHRRRSTCANDVPQFAHRARGTQIPIAHAAPPNVPPARFPSLEAFGRRPSACAAPSIIGPASETLHRSGGPGLVRRPSGSPSIADVLLRRHEPPLRAISGHPRWAGSWFQPANYLILR